jgi:glycosyltransferase involved in cell wall biosynthesis
MMSAIVFDGSVLGAGPQTGVGGSFLTTLQAYVPIAARPCVLLLPAKAVNATELRQQIPGLHIESRIPSGRIRKRQYLRHYARQCNAALFHSPVVALPKRLDCPSVATVHDIPWLHPELRREPGSRWSQRLALRQTIRSADALIVPSQATREDLLRATSTLEDKIETIPHGVLWPAEEAPETSSDRPFLVLGDARPRKNLERLSAAHAIAKDRDAELPDLRFVGPDHGYVQDAEKWVILRSSRALLHLATLEGFGIPVLEALAHGIPVVCSNQTSLPEVAGDAALLVDPRNVNAIADAMIRVHRDTKLRSELRQRGRQRSQQMTPSHSAQKWLRLHDKLIAAHKTRTLPKLMKKT